MRVGFLGLGIMGEPMAANLVRHGVDLTVWNRSDAAADRITRLGGVRATTPLQVVAECDVTIEMLATESAIEQVLEPGTNRFARAVRGRGLVHMSTTSPVYSSRLAERVAAAGGWYVEAPVSGSRTPARDGHLVAMVAGDDDRLDAIEPVLTAMCRSTLRCGRPPAATTMKLAVNTYLLPVVTALAEAWHFAERSGLDLEVFARAIREGQMSSPIAGVKLDRLLGGDFSPQAAVLDVLKNGDLIADAARAGGIAVPILQGSRELFAEAVAAGFGGLDMVGVLRAIEGRSERLTPRPGLGRTDRA